MSNFSSFILPRSTISSEIVILHVSCVQVCLLPESKCSRHKALDGHTSRWYIPKLSQLRKTPVSSINS